MVKKNRPPKQSFKKNAIQKSYDPFIPIPPGGQDVPDSRKDFGGKEGKGKKKKCVLSKVKGNKPRGLVFF